MTLLEYPTWSVKIFDFFRQNIFIFRLTTLSSLSFLYFEDSEIKQIELNNGMRSSLCGLANCRYIFRILCIIWINGIN